MEWFIKEEATEEQKKNTFTKIKSRAEVRLRNLCGSRHVASGIWAVGLPGVRLTSPFATEKQATVGIQRVTENVLHWPEMLALGIQDHKLTRGYQTAKRRSGLSKGQHGLTATELEERKARRQLRHAKFLARQWHAGHVTYKSCSKYQWQLLCQLWDGSLQSRAPPPQERPSIPNFSEV